MTATYTAHQGVGARPTLTNTPTPPTPDPSTVGVLSRDSARRWLPTNNFYVGECWSVLVVLVVLAHVGGVGGVGLPIRPCPLTFRPQITRREIP